MDARLIASVAGIGYAPRAAGTCGSLAGLALGVALIALSPAALPIGVVFATFLGLWAIRRCAGAEEDPGWIVIDEVAGQMTALMPLTFRLPAWPWLAVTFLLFRFFDIAKPGPVGWADRRHSALGVMADDLIAGALAAIVLLAFRLIFTERG